MRIFNKTDFNVRTMCYFGCDNLIIFLAQSSETIDSR